MARVPKLAGLPAGFLLIVVAGCSNLKDREFGDGDVVDDSDTSVDTDTGDDTDTADDTDTQEDTDTQDDTGDSEDTANDRFDEPGDIVPFHDNKGVVDVELGDESGESNRDQQFYLVTVNGGTQDLGYRVRYYPSDGGSIRPPPLAERPPVERAAPRAEIFERTPHRAEAPPPPLSAADIGSAHQEFLVRNDLITDSTYATVAGTLWALGDNVAIWVDDDVPIDWDTDCDGTVDIPDAYEAYGFTNCDLQDVADIVDDNIIPNIRSFYGEESDVNGDGRVSVVITPELNNITRTSTNEVDWLHVLSSYAEPQVDLNEFDYRTNPGSDEQEVIYVFAPDPNGFYNPNARTDVDNFTSYQLAGEFARSFTYLVSYNQHVILAEGAVEDDWVNDMLGTLAGDLCGFGASYFRDAWEYVDAPYLHPLVGDGSSGSLMTLSRGAQYLFARWLYDQAEATSEGSGEAMLTAIMQSGATGVDSVEAGTGADFEDLVVRWQIALLTTGVLADDGDPLVDPEVYIPYGDIETVSAPPDSPGDFYGANGYQRGINVHGTNRAYRGGTTDSPSELTEFRVRIENSDAWVYTPGFEFDGFIQGGYAADVVRLGGITFDEALLQIQATDEGLIGFVVRWNDPETVDYAVEDIFSPTDANNVSLPEFLPGGAPIHAIGQLSASSTVNVVQPDGDVEVEDVKDTDRWLLDLSAFESGEPVTADLWLKREFADTAGNSGPTDPWIAVVPEDYLPQPTVDGTHSSDSCDGAYAFSYPTSVLEYLYYQQLLASTMAGSDEEQDDWCGEIADEPPTCADDWDRDGVPDESEPAPTTLRAQILTQQCTLNGGVAPEPGATYSDDWMDADERDEDDLYTVSYAYNTGGRAGQEGEEGFVRVSLLGGQRYVIVVGDGGGGTGVYQLSVRQLTE